MTLTVAVLYKIPVAGLTHQTKREIDILSISGSQMDVFSMNTIPVTSANAPKVVE
jgi:hypothetical protein